MSHIVYPQKYVCVDLKTTQEPKPVNTWLVQKEGTLIKYHHYINKISGHFNTCLFSGIIYVNTAILNNVIVVKPCFSTHATENTNNNSLLCGNEYQCN